MLSLFSPRNGVDPKVYLTAIIGILAEYPKWVVEQVCDPVHGLAIRREFMPTPKDVRDACEGLWIPRLRELRREEAQILLERERYVFAETKAAPRQTVAEIKAEMAERGLDTSKWRE